MADPWTDHPLTPGKWWYCDEEKDDLLCGKKYSGKGELVRHVKTAHLDDK
jgi:hypothetical protein